MLNIRLYLVFCMTQWPNSDLGVLRVKTDDSDNLLCHTQKLALVAGTLTQEVIIVSKNSDNFIEIKALSLFYCHCEKKETVKVILNFFHLTCHVFHMTCVTLIQLIFYWLCNSCMKTLVQVLTVLLTLFWNC